MFGNVSLGVGKGTLKLTGFFGIRMFFRINKLLGKKKVKSIFNTVGSMHIEFPEFFRLEVIYILELLSRSRSTYGLNIGSLIKSIELLKDIVELDTPIDKSLISKELVFQPLGYQEDLYLRYPEVKREMGYRGMLLDAKTGTGKTYMSLSLAIALGSDKVVIVIPKEVYETVWIPAFTKGKDMLFHKETPFWYVNGKNKYNGEKYIVVTMENLKHGDSVVNVIRSLHTTIIIEESHKFNNKNSLRSERLNNFINETGSDNILPMSGTALTSGSLEVASIMRHLDRRFTPDIEKRFISVYGKPSNIFKELLPFRFQSSSLLIKKEVLNLTEPIIQYLNVNVDNPEKYSLATIREDMRVYIGKRLAYYDTKKQEYTKLFGIYQDKYKEGMIASSGRREYLQYQERLTVLKIHGFNRELSTLAGLINKYEKKHLFPIMENDEKKIYREIAPVIKYVELKVGGEALGNIVMKALIECHVDMASNIDYKAVITSVVNKTVAFSSFVDVLDSAINTAEKQNIRKYSRVYGKYIKNIGSEVGKFRSEDKNSNQVMFATYNSLGTGTPMPESNCVLLLNLPFRNHIYDQAIARVWRGGQKEVVNVYIANLNYDKPNINSRNIDIIKYFKEAVEEITGRKDILTLNGQTVDSVGEPDLKAVEFLNNMYAGGTLKGTVKSSSPIKVLQQWLKN